MEMGQTLNTSFLAKVKEQCAKILLMAFNRC